MSKPPAEIFDGQFILRQQFYPAGYAVHTALDLTQALTSANSTQGDIVATQKSDPQSKEAKHGEKMIEVKIRFWTDEIADEKGKVLQKHAWTSGVVRIEGNKSHGITPSKPLPFHSLLDVGAVVEKVLIEHGVVLHPSQRMKKYVQGK